MLLSFTYLFRPYNQKPKNFPLTPPSIAFSHCFLTWVSQTSITHLRNTVHSDPYHRFLHRVSRTENTNRTAHSQRCKTKSTVALFHHLLTPHTPFVSRSPHSTTFTHRILRWLAHAGDPYRLKHSTVASFHCLLTPQPPLTRPHYTFPTPERKFHGRLLTSPSYTVSSVTSLHCEHTPHPPLTRPKGTSRPPKNHIWSPPSIDVSHRILRRLAQSSNK